MNANILMFSPDSPRSLLCAFQASPTSDCTNYTASRVSSPSHDRDLALNFYTTVRKFHNHQTCVQPWDQSFPLACDFRRDSCLCETAVSFYGRSLSTFCCAH